MKNHAAGVTDGKISEEKNMILKLFLHVMSFYSFFFGGGEAESIALTGCSLNIVFFPKHFVIFLNSASSAAALVFYLPGDTEGKQRKVRVWNILKSS